MRVDLSSGFLFRPTSKKGGILNAPLLASTVQARLIKYLSSLGINDGESVRAGNSILLRLLGVSREEVAKHIGWKSTALVDYDTQVEKVMTVSTSSDALARIVLLTVEAVHQQNIWETHSVDVTFLLAFRRLS